MTIKKCALVGYILVVNMFTFRFGMALKMKKLQEITCFFLGITELCKRFNPIKWNPTYLFESLLKAVSTENHLESHPFAFKCWFFLYFFRAKKEEKMCNL